MNSKVNEWIEAHQDELVNDIMDLCSIDSVKGEALEGKPFGEGPYNSLHAAMELTKKYGFETKNYDNYVAAADFDTSLPRSLDMLAHTDVVPAGEGWTVTEPFKPVIKDGRIYGRGTSDDKGPLLCALYAMRALKETGVELKKGVRLIMGADEECGSSDIEKYYEVEDEAEMTFSPDAEFPLINIEKGHFNGTLFKDFKEDSNLPRVTYMKAGVAANAVPQKAVLRFEGLDFDKCADAISEVSSKCEVEITKTADDELTVVGTGAHASTPELGKNAGLAAIELIKALPLYKSEQVEMISKVTSLFPYGVTDGSGIGIKMCDEESHDLTNTLDLFEITPTHIEFTFDSRTPIMATKENCSDVAEKTIRESGFDFATDGMIPPHVVPGDSEFVQTLLKSYENVTGLKGECLAIGGGTYVHELKNGVAFGAVLPDIDTRMHGADEFFDIDNIIIATKVYAEAIINLCA
ncbi:MAG: Sapep family Mn(2+)-dependent dipeptidase [Lachnospiraceae bacterium]|nr:Sapep family Mn(2+)-dependent dipeptidase [Lachnospiraceae bacterium]